MKSWHVESTDAHDHVMTVRVGLAKCEFLRDATAVRSRKTYYVATELRRSRADNIILPPMALLSWRSGWARSNAQMCAVGLSIAENTVARSSVINSTRSHHTVLELPIL